MIAWQGRYKLSFAEAWAKRFDVSHGMNHQGVYAATIEGELLGCDGDPHSAERTLQMIEEALTKWKTRKTQLKKSTVDVLLERDPDFVWQYPEDGLVLHVGIHDLPRQVDRRPDNWRHHAHNLDYVWILRDEMLEIIPPRVRAGDVVPFPRKLTRRLARFHLLDYVHGETPPWPSEVADRAEIELHITRATKSMVEATLKGKAPLCERNVEGTGIERGFDATLLGKLVFDRRKQRFSRFDVVAVGSRWGSTGHSGRRGDDDPAPMGIAFTLAGNKPRDRTPPHISQSRNGLLEYFR